MEIGHALNGFHKANPPVTREDRRFRRRRRRLTPEKTTGSRARPESRSAWTQRGRSARQWRASDRVLLTARLGLLRESAPLIPRGVPRPSEAEPDARLGPTSPAGSSPWGFARSRPTATPNPTPAW